MNEESIQKHWEYVREAVRDGRDEADTISMTVHEYLENVGYHYKTAMLHGYKHGVEINSE